MEAWWKPLNLKIIHGLLLASTIRSSSPNRLTRIRCLEILLVQPLNSPSASSQFRVRKKLLNVAKSWWSGVSVPGTIIAIAGLCFSPWMVFARQEPPSCPKIDTLCVLAEDQVEVDYKTGVADFRGDVRGQYTPQGTVFWADNMRAFRGPDGNWKKLELAGHVNAEQPGLKAVGDFGELTEKRVSLEGSARIERPPHWIDGNKLEILDDPRKLTARGSGTKQAHLLYIEQTSGESPTESSTRKVPPAKTERTTAEKVPERMEVWADDLVVDDLERIAVFSGAVRVTQASQKMELKAKAVRLNFDENNQYKNFRAEGDVKILQPNRTLSADLAISKDDNSTILLIGKANVRQAGQFNLASDKIEVYTDPEKGVVKSEEEKKPLSVSFNLQGQTRPYTLTRKGLTGLAQKGVPGRTIAALAPLAGKKFSNREDLVEAIHKILPRFEVTQFLEKIIEAAE